MRSAAPTDDGRPDDDTQVAPRQRQEAKRQDRIVGLIGADRPSRIVDARTPRRAEPEPPPEPAAPRRIGADLAVCGLFGLFAALLTLGLWPDPHTRQLALGGNDQVLSEWFLAYDARIYAGDFSLVTDRLNAPDGVSLLANASVILLGLLLGPVTLAFGAPVSFALATALNLAATAGGWYLLLARTVGTRRFAAAVGGLVAGFGPGMMSQANGHPHITAQWLTPAIAWCVLRMADPDRPRAVLTGALLGFLVTLQYHLGPEVLMITAIAVFLFCAAYAAAAWPDAKRRLATTARGLGIAGAVAGLLLAYPLWLQFAGPQHVRGGPFPSYYFGLDAASLTTISPLALGGDRAAASLSTDPAEYNGFFGIPLLLAVAGITLWLWRRPVAVACAAAAAAMVVLALGPALTIDGGQTGVALPYALIDSLPGVSAALPSRFALAAGPLFAVIVALAIDTALAVPTRARLIVPVAVLAALAPVAPTPLPTEERPAVPRYFTSGLWRSCAGDNGGVLVPVPLPEPRHPESMRWAAAADARFALPEGSFIGPYGEDGRATLGAFPRPTSLLLAQVADTGQAPAVTDAQRRAAADDARYWRARCFVLAEQKNDAPLRETVTQLLGQKPQRVADVEVWKL